MQGYVPVELGSEDQMADRHAVASSEKERQHDENADVGMKPVSASVLEQHCKFAGSVFYIPCIPHSTTR